MSGGRVLAFLRLTRPIFLLGGAIMHALGLAWVADDAPRLDLLAAAIGMVMVTATQLVAQYANEYFDNDADLSNPNRTYFSGGSGVFAAQQLPRVVALRAAQVCAGISVAAILFLALRAPVAAGIGAVSLLGAWFYSAPPPSLMGTGWGELEASVLVAVFVPYAAYATQSSLLSPSLILVCLPLFFLHLAMLIAFSLPDRETDAPAGKRTLAVRLGLRVTLLLHTLLLVAAMAALAGQVAPGFGRVAMIPALAFIVAQGLLARMTAGRKPRWGWFSFAAVGSFALAAAGLLAGLLI